VTVPFGGTGQTVLTTSGVLLGEGSGNVNVTAPGTDGQLLIGSTGTDPIFNTLTSSSQTLSFVAGPGTLNLEVNFNFPSFNPLPVPNGGTGRTVLTSFGVLLGEGSNNINVTNAGTNGQLLIGGTGTDPKFSTVTSSLATLTFSVGSGTLNIDLNAPVTVPFGGTGRTVLTSFGVLLGEGSGNVNVTAAGTNGQLLIGGTGTDPKFSTVTSSLATLTFSVGSGTLNVDLNAPVTVPFGGTGQTVLTTSGVLLGEGSGNVNVTAPGTDGQLLIGSTGTDPIFNTLTSSSQTLSFVAGPGTLNLEVNFNFPSFNPLPVPNGGTGRTVLTSFGVLLGEGSNNINVTNAGTNGQLLIGGTGTDPKFSTVTSSLATLTFSVGSGTLNIDLNAPVTVPFGGTGRTVLTSFGVLLGEGSGNVNVTAAGLDGQLLIGSSGTDPIFNYLTSTLGTIAITPGSGLLNIDVVGGGLVWMNITSPTAQMDPDFGYIANYTLGSVDLTLPTTSAIGTVIRISGAASTGWNVVANSGQVIHFGSHDSTTTTFALMSYNQRDAIELLCVTADTEWNVLSAQGNIYIN